jgi:hypothetical protein
MNTLNKVMTDFIQTITDWANQNQGLLAILIFLATIIVAWFSGFLKWIFHKFFHKQPVPFISAGGDIKAGGNITVGNRTFVQKTGKGSENVQGENITVNKYGGNK